MSSYSTFPARSIAVSGEWKTINTTIRYEAVDISQQNNEKETK